MRNTTSGPRSGLWLIALAGLTLLVTALLSACSSGPTPAPFESPVETSTPPPYPPPGDTPPPKPTHTPAPTPTITPVPTPLPLPASAYLALWVETVLEDNPGGPQGTIWRAEPKDIAGRQQVVHFDDQEITQAAVSPDGSRIAFTAAPRQARQSPLWLINVNGQGLRQLLPDAKRLAWSRDGHTIAYTAGEIAQGWVLETVDIATGAIHHLANGEPGAILPLLGWSANDRKVYYVWRGQGYEVWAADRNGQGSPRKVATLEGELGQPLLSPDGTKLQYGYGSPQGAPLLDLAQGTTRRVQLPGQWYVTWGLDSTELLVIDVQTGTLILRSFNTITDQSQDIALIPNVPLAKWEPLALSPDRQWLAAFHYYSGLHWLYLPSGMVVPVPQQGLVIFLGWISR